MIRDLVVNRSRGACARDGLSVVDTVEHGYAGSICLRKGWRVEWAHPYELCVTGRRKTRIIFPLWRKPCFGL